jgi:hypothetical protein
MIDLLLDHGATNPSDGLVLPQKWCLASIEGFDLCARCDNSGALRIKAALLNAPPASRFACADQQNRSLGSTISLTRWEFVGRKIQSLFSPFLTIALCGAGQRQII